MTQKMLTALARFESLTNEKSRLADQITTTEEEMVELAAKIVNRLGLDWPDTVSKVFRANNLVYEMSFECGTIRKIKDTEEITKEMRLENTETGS